MANARILAWRLVIRTFRNPDKFLFLFPWFCTVAGPLLLLSPPPPFPPVCALFPILRRKSMMRPLLRRFQTSKNIQLSTNIKSENFGDNGHAAAVYVYRIYIRRKVTSNELVAFTHASNQVSNFHPSFHLLKSVIVYRAYISYRRNANFCREKWLHRSLFDVWHVYTFELINSTFQPTLSQKLDHFSILCAFLKFYCPPSPLCTYVPSLGWSPFPPLYASHLPLVRVLPVTKIDGNAGGSGRDAQRVTRIRNSGF